MEGYIIHKAGLMTGGRGPESKSGKRRFEEADVQNLQRVAAKLKDEIERLPKADRRGTQEETLQIDLGGLERRLAAVKDELVAFNKNSASKKRELDNQKKQLRELQPKYEEQAEQLKNTRETCQEFRDAIARVEDQVFADFCTRLGYSDIRAYDASQGKLEQQVSEKRSQFEVQKQRLSSRLQYEETRKNDTTTRINRVQSQVKGLNSDIKQYTKEKDKIHRAMQEDQDELEALQETLEESKTELTEKNQKVAEAKTEVQKRRKDIDAHLRDINGLEATVQKNSTSKSALLRRCRLEQIKIPLSQGTLDDLPNEDNLLHQDADAMDVDGDDGDQDMMDMALDDHGIEIDFDGLDEELKNVSLTL